MFYERVWARSLGDQTCRGLGCMHQHGQCTEPYHGSFDDLTLSSSGVNHTKSDG